MRLKGYISALLVFFAASIFIAHAQTVRLANGSPIKGDVYKTTPDGLEYQTPAGPKKYTWEMLSPATRYRFQPKFRANYEYILQGLHQDSWPNPPDSDDLGATTPVSTATPTTPSETPPPEEPAPIIPTAMGSTNLNIFEQFTYQNVNPVRADEIPNLKLRVPALATYTGFQYGPNSNEIVLLTFDTKSADDIHDSLFVYSPAYPLYTRTVQLGGIKKTTGSNVSIDFKRFRLGTRFGQADVVYDIECTYLLTQTNILRMKINVDFIKGNKRSRLMLARQPIDVIQGGGLINIQGIVDLPMLWMSLIMEGSSAQMAGNLHMANWEINPVDGVDNRVNITVMDDQGNAVQKDGIKINESAFDQKNRIIDDMKKVEAGKVYTVNASINLEPFLGNIKYEDKITIPAAVK